MRSLTHSNHSIELDRYIASNAAGFAIMHYPLRLSLNTKDVASSSLDSLLLSEPELYRGLALSTDEEFGVVSYAESGVAATGEFLFMRLLQTPEIVQQQFEQWAEQGMVRKVDQSYYVQSDLIAELFGGGLSTFDNFYVNFSGDATFLLDNSTFLLKAAVLVIFAILRACLRLCARLTLFNSFMSE